MSPVCALISIGLYLVVDLGLGPGRALYDDDDDVAAMDVDYAV